MNKELLQNQVSINFNLQQICYLFYISVLLLVLFPATTQNHLISIDLSINQFDSSQLDTKKSDFPLITIQPTKSILNGTYVYFVHGYYGKNSDFADLANYLIEHDLLTRYDKIMFFDYFERGQKEGLSKIEIHEKFNISDFASDFYLKLINSSGIQLDIVAHSLGGLISREMIRLYKTNLEKNEIRIGRIITLGTPHMGIHIARNPLLGLVDALTGGTWNTPVLNSLAPNSRFFQLLNANISSYSEGIDWYTVAGIANDIFGILTSFIVGESNDGLVGFHSASAELVEDSFPHILSDSTAFLLSPQKTLVLNGVNHGQLVYDPGYQRSYPYLNKWLSGRI